MTNQSSDREFADRALKRLAPEIPQPAFEAALLAAYDGWNAARPQGRWAALREALRLFSESIWPGAPVWAPVSAFALALVIGAGLGAVLPPVPAGDEPVFSLEQPASFSLSSIGAVQEDL